MMYATLLAQAALIASLALFGGPAPTADSRAHPLVAAADASATHDKAKLRCRLYFGCVPTPSLAVQD